MTESLKYAILIFASGTHTRITGKNSSIFFFKMMI